MSEDLQIYFSAVPDERKDLVTQLHDLILGLYPNAEVDMRYKMPTYSLGDGWVALANQKHYVSLYTCGAHHLSEFKEKHPGIKTGKGCINFRLSDRLPVVDVRNVVTHAMEHPKG